MVVAPVCPCYILCMVSQRCSDPETLSVLEGLKVVNLVPTIFIPWHEELSSSCCSWRSLHLHHCFYICQCFSNSRYDSDMLWSPPSFYFVFFIRRWHKASPVSVQCTVVFMPYAPMPRTLLQIRWEAVQLGVVSILGKLQWMKGHWYYSLGICLKNTTLVEQQATILNH